ncbi:MAG TPA: class I SAM-dependent methyltransferase [Acetobacteraceae bacterium]|nr:class I SAM-dependent methyltransferase [Acetobacteraceae bacterium]
MTTPKVAFQNGLRYLYRWVMLPHRANEALIRVQAIEAGLRTGTPTTPASPVAATPGEIYSGWSATDLPLFDLFSHAQPQPCAGFVTDWVGTRTRTSSLWDWAREYDGKVTPRPVPHDLYEAIEWVGLLRAVASSRHGRFTMMELGAGFAPWLGAGASAARLRGIGDVHLMGVEADPGRFALMQQHFLDNGLDPATHRLVCAAVGVGRGRARWPRIADPANASGARPVREDGGGLDIADSAYMAGAVDDFIDVDILPLPELLEEQPEWDLLHMDVQGWETALCAGCADALTRRVRRMVIGTHSRAIDGEIIVTMRRAGWVLENEKPTRFTFDPSKGSLELMTEVDGVQVWRNSRFGDEREQRAGPLSKAIGAPAHRAAEVVAHLGAVEARLAPVRPNGEREPDGPRCTSPPAPRIHAPALRAEHVAGAVLYANRSDALELFPSGGSIAEIGVALGDFSHTMLRRLRPARFDAFDLFRLHEEQAFWGRTSQEWFAGRTHREHYEWRFAAEIAAGIMRLHEGDSAEHMSKLPDASFDMIYIDGDHSYQGVLRDAEVSARKLKPTGTLVFNDYTCADHLTGSQYGVVPVVNALCLEGAWTVVYFALQQDLFCDIGLRRRGVACG